MKPISVELENVGRFEHLHLPMDGLDGLIAVTGTNGAGKTTAVEAMLPAALWGVFPSYGPFAHMVTQGARLGRLTTILEHQGARYRITHEARRTSTGRLSTPASVIAELQGGGWVPLSDGRVGPYREVVERLFPSRSLVEASVFSASRGSLSFAELKTAARRDLFAELLGLGELQALADRAAGHLARCDAELAPLDKRAGEVAGLVARATELAEAIAVAEDRATQTATEHAAAREAQNAAAGAAGEARAAAQAERDRVDRARQELAEVGPEVARLQAELAAPAVGAVDVDMDALQARADEHRKVDAKHQAAAADRAAAENVLRTGRASNARTEAAARRTEGEIRRCNQALQGEPGALRKRVAELELVKEPAPAPGGPTWRMDHRRAQQDVDRLTTEIDLAERRAQRLDAVPCGGGVLNRGGRSDWDPVDCSACEPLADATAARAALPQLRKDLDEATDRLVQTTAIVAEHEAVRAARDEYTAARAELSQLRATLEVHGRASADLERATGELAELQADIEAWKATEAEIIRRGTELRDEMAGLAAQLHALQGADDDLRAAQRQLQQESARLRNRVATEQALQAARERQQELRRVSLDADILDRHGTAEAASQAAYEALRVAQAADNEARSQLAQLRGALAELGDVAADAAELETVRRDRAQERAGWRLLAQALGRDGVQALEIDAAGPDVSALVTDLLSASFGPRFSVELRTTRPTARGNGLREVFDLVVNDQRGTRPFELVSEGERVLLGEALKLAIAVYNAQRHGQRWRTLWRDECDGRLAPDVAPMYPRMLREAMRLGGFDRVIYVTHRPTCWEQADVHLHFDGGSVEVTCA